MIGEILSLVGDVAGMINSNNAHDDYSEAIKKMADSQRIATSAKRAEGIFASQANTGLNGYETMKEDALNLIPETLGATKDWLTSGQAVDYVARASAMADKQLRELNYANENQLTKNRSEYANYLGGTMTNQENLLQAIRNNFNMGIAYNNADKTSAANKYIGAMTNKVAGMTDKDWAEIIALLSKDDPVSLVPTAPKTTLSEPWTT